MSFAKIQTAVLALRKRTGVNYAAAVKAGRFQLQVVSFDRRGKSTVQAITDWLSIDDLLRAVDAA